MPIIFQGCDATGVLAQGFDVMPESFMLWKMVVIGLYDVVYVVPVRSSLSAFWRVFLHSLYFLVSVSFLVFFILVNNLPHLLIRDLTFLLIHGFLILFPLSTFFCFGLISVLRPFNTFSVFSGAVS